jgi:hypothetical protein
MEKELAVKEKEITEVAVFKGEPEEVLKAASKVAKMVAKIIENRNLYCTIEKKKFVYCEGWTTMGSILGLRAIITNVEEKENEVGEKKYVAIAEVYKGDKLISRAEAECAAWEKKRQNLRQDDFVLRSTAQTRAIAKAYRLCLSWVMSLAGYEPTPAEEMEDAVNGERKVVTVETPVVKKETASSSGDDMAKKNEAIVVEAVKEEEERRKLYSEVVRMCKERKMTMMDVHAILEKINPTKAHINALTLAELREFRKEVEKIPLL